MARRLVPLVLTAALVACGPAGPAPIVTLADRACGSKPDLIAVPTLAMGETNRLEIVVDEKTPCVQQPDGNRSAYVAIVLPYASEPYVLTIRSSIVGQTVFAPRVELLDGSGRVLRQLPRSSFTFHGTDIYLGVRAHVDERFLVVYSDATTAGEQESQVHEGVQRNSFTSASAHGAMTVTFFSGIDRTITFTYAHNGKLTVTAMPLPKAN